jgi:hypothetical protein
LTGKKKLKKQYEAVGQLLRQTGISQWLQANERFKGGNECFASSLYVYIFLGCTLHPFSIMQAALHALHATHLLCLKTNPFDIII